MDELTEALVRDSASLDEASCLMRAAAKTILALLDERERWQRRAETAEEGITNVASQLTKARIERDDLRAELTRAEENDRCSREFLAVADERWKAAEAEAAGLRKALEFYAERANWKNAKFTPTDEPNTIQHIPSTINRDRGERARSALTTKGTAE